MDEIRTRVAPSPTGWLHIGTARVALFNWLLARKYNGQFILRIEDTDKLRSTEEYELDIMEGLSWLGLGWDEGPETPDNVGPYRQSERLELYKKYANQLIEEKKAYWCYCTPEELEQERNAQETAHEAPRYSGKCCHLTDEEIKKFESEGRKPALRFIVPSDKKVKFKDLIKGEVEFDPALLGDFVILKSDGWPAFILAVTIDDAEMKISHVVRGEDHLSNTPKQILLAEALNLPRPEYAHLSMILNTDRTKMSKRKNPVSVTRDFRDQGYLPEAMINFIALLGWAPKIKNEKDEIFGLEELINEFDLSNLGKSPAIFDQSKLDFFNGYYIRKLPLGELAKRCLPYLEKAGLIQKENETVLKAIALVQERMKKLSEVPELTEFFFREPQYEPELLIAKGADKEITIKALQESVKVLLTENDFSRDSIEPLLRAFSEKIEVKVGHLLWPIRAALSGKPASPGTFELLEFFGKDESLKRIDRAINMLQ